MAPRVARLRASGCRRAVPRRPRPRTRARSDDRRHRHCRQDDDRGVPRPATARGRSRSAQLDRARRQPLADGRAPPRARHGRRRDGADELTSLLHDAKPDDRGRHVVLARPRRASRVARALPRGEGGDRADAVRGRRGRRQRGRRRRRRDRLTLAWPPVWVLAVTRGPGGRIPPWRVDRRSDAGAGTRPACCRRGSTRRDSKRCWAQPPQRSRPARLR